MPQNNRGQRTTSFHGVGPGAWWQVLKSMVPSHWPQSTIILNKYLLLFKFLNPSVFLHFYIPRLVSWLLARIRAHPAVALVSATSLGLQFPGHWQSRGDYHFLRVNTAGPFFAQVPTCCWSSDDMLWRTASQNPSHLCQAHIQLYFDNISARLFFLTEFQE